MDAAEILDRVSARFGPAIAGANLQAIDPWIAISPPAIADVGLFVRDEPSLAFNYLNCISGVDYLETDPKKQPDGPPRVELWYHLSSLVHRHRIVLKVVLPRWRDDVPGQLPEVATVSTVWRAALWHEREVFDLMGIRFVGHPDLRRILCPEDWEGYPLRKDYVMPLEYHGIRGR